MQISGLLMDLTVSEVMGQEMWTFSKHPWDILRYRKVRGFLNWIFPLSRHYLESRQEQVWWQREPLWSLCPAPHQMPAFVLPLGPSHSGCSMRHTCPTASLPRSGYGGTTHPRAQARELAVIRLLILNFSSVTEYGQFHLQNHSQKCLLPTYFPLLLP